MTITGGWRCHRVTPTSATKPMCRGRCPPRGARAAAVLVSAPRWVSTRSLPTIRLPRRSSTSTTPGAVRPVTSRLPRHRSIDTAITHGENGASGGKVEHWYRRRGCRGPGHHDGLRRHRFGDFRYWRRRCVAAAGTGTFSETTTDATAAGSSVAVGASVSVDVLTESVSAQAARSIVHHRRGRCR